MLSGAGVLLGAWLVLAPPASPPSTSPSPTATPASPLSHAPWFHPVPNTAAPAPFHWAVPGLVSTLDVPGQMNVGGMPIRLRVYSSRERVETLLSSFANAAIDAGFYVPPTTPRLMLQPHLTALDTRTLTAYTIILNPEPGGRTTIVLGEARMNQKVELTEPTLVPVYPEAKQVLRGDFEGAQTLSFWVAARPEQIEEWYRTRLLTAGYAEEEPRVFRRQGQEVRLSLKPDRMGIAVLLFINTTSAGSSLQAAP